LKKYWYAFLTITMIVFFAAGCLTSDDDDDSSDTGTDTEATDTTPDSGDTFSEKMRILYDSYLSDRDSLIAHTNAKLSDINTSYSARKSAINRQFFDAIEEAFLSESTDKSSSPKRSAGQTIDEIMEAAENYLADSSEEKGSAVDAANDALSDYEAGQEALDSGLEIAAESALAGSSDDGSSLYDAVEGMLESEGGSGDSGDSSGESVVNACLEEFGDGSGGDSGGDFGLGEIGSHIEDYNNAGDQQSRDSAANDVLDSIQEQLDQTGPEGESDARLIEDIVNDYLEGGTSESEVLDHIRNLLDIPIVSDALLPFGPQEITLDITYDETLSITAGGLNTQTDDMTVGPVVFTVDIPLGVTRYDYDAEGELVYQGSGSDNITGTTWINSGTSDVVVTGSIYIGEDSKPMILIDMEFTYSFTNTTKHPYLGDITIPGEKESFTDTVVMEYKNGATYEYTLDMATSSLTKEVLLTIGD